MKKTNIGFKVIAAFFKGICTGLILTLYLLGTILIPALVFWFLGGLLVGAFGWNIPVQIGAFSFPAFETARYIKLPLWGLLVLGIVCVLFGIAAEIIRVVMHHDVTSLYSLNTAFDYPTEPQIDISVLPQMCPSAFGQELSKRIKVLIESTEECIRADDKNPAKEKMRRLIANRNRRLSARSTALKDSLKNLFDFWLTWFSGLWKTILGVLIGIFASMLITAGSTFLIEKYANFPEPVEFAISIILFVGLIAGPMIGCKIASNVDIDGLTYFWREKFGLLYCKLFLDHRIHACDEAAMKAVMPACAQAQRNHRDMVAFLENNNNTEHPIAKLFCFSSLLKSWDNWRTDWKNNQRYGELALDVNLAKLLSLCESCETWDLVFDGFRVVLLDSVEQYEERQRQERIIQQREEEQKKLDEESKRAEEELALQKQRMHEEARYHFELEREAVHQTEELEKLRKMLEYEQWKRNYQEIHGK